jgi:hypothetical protein
MFYLYVIESRTSNDINIIFKSEDKLPTDYLIYLHILNGFPTNKYLNSLHVVVLQPALIVITRISIVSICFVNVTADPRFSSRTVHATLTKKKKINL